jgi:hypothetical protein
MVAPVGKDKEHNVMNRFLFAMLNASFLIVLGCGSHESEILKRITEASNKSTVIDLRPVADSRWDRLLVFRPYTPKATIENRIGSHWFDTSKINTIESFDNVCLLVFVSGNEVVASALVLRNLADFHEDHDILRDQAMFEFTGKEKLVSLVSSGLSH